MASEQPPIRLAIMQPYLFPYIGYFQLVSAVDIFVVYDDVNYMKQGWVNRNNVLVDNKAHRFTLPVKAASSFALIKDVEVDPRAYRPWREKFLRTLTQAYSKAPYVKKVTELVSSVLKVDATHIAEISRDSVFAVSAEIGLSPCFVPSSRTFGNADLKAQVRVLDICRQVGAGQYVNAIGGTELYRSSAFKEAGCSLSFLKPGLSHYNQFKGPFVAGLSIIDVLMFNEPVAIGSLLHDNELQYP